MIELTYVQELDDDEKTTVAFAPRHITKVVDYGVYRAVYTVDGTSSRVSEEYDYIITQLQYSR